MATQVVQVGSAYPPTSVVTITGSGTVTGQAITGYSGTHQFGTVTTRLGGPPQTKTVSGLGSPQAFGSIKTTLTKQIGAVNSAQAFGVPSSKTTVNRAVGGVPSAQVFGIPLLKAVIKTGAGGVASAQTFGTPTAKAIFKLTVGAVASAQGFGAVTTRTGFTRSVGSVGSAQAFGVPHAAFVQALPLAGIASPQAFGTPTITGAIRRQPGGVPSAQAFGRPFFIYPQTVALGGISSAQAFGTLFLVFNVWLHDALCLDLDLDEPAYSSEDLDALVCLGPGTYSICAIPTCGDGHLTGGNNVFSYPITDPSRTQSLQAASELDLDLQPVGCQ